MSMTNRFVFGAAMLAAVSVASAQEGTPPKIDQKVTNAPKWSIYNSSEVIGATVFNDQGDELGKIDDVAVYGNGQIAYAVLSYGGVLGVGDKLFALPWSLLRAKHEGDENNLRLAINIDKDRLKNAPGFDKDHWPSGADFTVLDSTDKYYAAERRAADMDRKTAGHAVEASARNASTVVLRVGKLDGRNVENAAGEKIGDIKTVYIDPSYGRVNYVALSVGGFLGIGDRVVAVPWDAFKTTVTDNKEKLTLNSTKEQLEKAPQYLSEETKAKDMVDPTWLGSVYSYYTVRPYWSDMARPAKN